jgi:hypothetical protein
MNGILIQFICESNSQKLIFDPPFNLSFKLDMMITTKDESDDFRVLFNSVGIYQPQTKSKVHRAKRVRLEGDQYFYIKDNHNEIRTFEVSFVIDKTDIDEFKILRYMESLTSPRMTMS